MAEHGEPQPAEKSPLLIKQATTTSSSSSASTEHESSRLGQATLSQTVINLAKTCAGTGILALPYAASEGGTAVFVVGLIAIAAWNVYCVQRLVQCFHLADLEDERRPRRRPRRQDPEQQADCPDERSEDCDQNGPPSTATVLGKVAWVAWGNAGRQAMDINMIILLIGIVVSYLAGIISFLSDTPLTGGPFCDALAVATIMAALSTVPDLGYLSNASAVGLAVLAGTFLVITGYGLAGGGGGEKLEEDNGAALNSNLNLFPSSLTGLSHYFGICVYGYGVVPLTYNFRDSMREPNRLVEATTLALSVVAVVYCVVGVGMLALFPNVSGQILHELPNTGLLPTLTRVAMSLVCVVTAPLLIVPAGEMIEAKLRISRRHYRWVVRSGVCLIGVVVAVLLPTFVQVLSVVGCLCVGLVGFVVPPFLHLRLLQLRGAAKGCILWVDAVMLMVGIITTVVGTWLTIG